MKALPIGCKGWPLANGRLPAICAPLVAASADALAQEAAVVAAKEPDLLEWRVDFFQGIADTQQVLAAARRIREAARGIPLLFTRRWTEEGGQSIAIDEPEVIALYEQVCASGLAEFVDYEASHEKAEVARVRKAARAAGVKVFVSYHNFQRTPAREEIVQRFARAQALGADVAKVAVMPQQPDDVLALLQATLEASRALDIPVVSMSMGPWGSLSRLCGGAFGSALTFAVGASSSAPGQMAIEDVRAGIALVRKGLGG